MSLQIITFAVACHRAHTQAASLKCKYKLLHRKCDVRIFIHELQDFGKRTSECSERVSFPKSCNE